MDAVAEREIPALSGNGILVMQVPLLTELYRLLSVHVTS
jgi:hypothetical protein